MVKLEICVDSLESAENAVAGGADELEVCSCLGEGGLTPSIGLLKEIIRMRDDDTKINKRKSKIKINVMIRCRSSSNFCFTNQEVTTMLSDIEFFKTMDIDSFVFGALTNTQEVDKDNCQRILDKAQLLPVSFHRAFDVCKNPDLSIQAIIDLGFKRLLTSGLKESVGDPGAKDLIGHLMNCYGDKIEIMPGSGVCQENVVDFVNLGCHIVHSSCKLTKQLPCGDIRMGSGEIYVTNTHIVRNLKAAICNASLEGI